MCGKCGPSLEDNDDSLQVGLKAAKLWGVKSMAAIVAPGSSWATSSQTEYTEFMLQNFPEIQKAIHEQPSPQN